MSSISWLSSLFCLSSLLVVGFWSRSSFSDQYTDAKNKTIQAIYLYEHIDEDVDKFLKYYENKLGPEEKKYGGFVVFVTKVVIQKKVQLTWRFP